MALLHKMCEPLLRRFTQSLRFASTGVDEITLSGSSDTSTAKDVSDTSVDENEEAAVQRMTFPYSQKALKTLKFDQYPYYIEREWWKTGNRMTFWATWRQLRDVKKRNNIAELGPVRMRWKAMNRCSLLPQAVRDECAEKLLNATRYEQPNLILNMCQFTGRQRGKIKPYRVNRHIFRRLADHGQLSGVERAAW